jgi:hypothetical protein
MTNKKSGISQEWLIEIALFIVLLVCYAYTPPRWADWNQNSHFDTIVALVDHGTLSIDCCVANTGDYALFEGHAYSDKAPGLSFLGVPFYIVYDGLTSTGPIRSGLDRLAHSDALAATLREGGTGLLADKVHFALGLLFVTFFVVAMPSALLGIVLYRWLGAFTTHTGYRLLAVLIYGLATPAFSYAGAFYSHQLAAVLLFISFALIFWLKPDKSGWGRLALIGALLGYAVISEYPSALIAGLLFLYVLYRLADKRRVGWVILGGIGPGLLLAAYNYVTYRTILPVGYHYSALWQTQHSTGFMSLTYPKLDILWGIIGSPYRGLFLLSPILLLAVPGFIYLWQDRQHRAEAIVSTLAVLSFFAFNSSSSMWWGGFSVGPRYLIPMLPFLAWPLIYFLKRYGQRVWARMLTGGLTVLSLILVWGLSLAGQHFPEETWQFPLRDYAWPRLAQSDLARNIGMAVGLHGWSSLIPLLVILALVVMGGWLSIKLQVNKE